MYIGILKVGFISAATLCAMTIVKLNHRTNPRLKSFYQGELASAIVAFLEKAGIKYDNDISLESIEPIILENKDKDKEAYERVDKAIKAFRANPEPSKHGIFCILQNATLIASHLLAFREPVLDAMINKQYLKISATCISSASFFMLGITAIKKHDKCANILKEDYFSDYPNLYKSIPCFTRAMIVTAGIAVNIVVCDNFVSQINENTVASLMERFR